METIKQFIKESSATIGQLLIASQKTMSAAESCTGGMISASITGVAGSSAYYLGSVTSYAVSVKENVLHVPAETINKYGVVSEETAASMAKGILEITGSDYAVSTTGIAGPGGAEPNHPVGTVCIGIASQKNGKVSTKAYTILHEGDRSANILYFTAAALDKLCNEIKNNVTI